MFRMYPPAWSGPIWADAYSPKSFFASPVFCAAPAISGDTFLRMTRLLCWMKCSGPLPPTNTWKIRSTVPFCPKKKLRTMPPRNSVISAVICVFRPERSGTVCKRSSPHRPTANSCGSRSSPSVRDGMWFR